MKKVELKPNNREVRTVWNDNIVLCVEANGLCQGVDLRRALKSHLYMADEDVASAVRSKLKKVGQAAAVSKRNWPTVGEQQQAAAAKVKRYWPGKAPAWAEEPDEHYDLREALNDKDEQSYERPIVDVDDARIRRLQESRRDREEAVARHRQIRAAEIVSTENEERGDEEKRQEDEEGEEDDDAIEERRRRIRERLLQKQKEEELPEED